MAVTGIGSLPHADPEEAVRVVAALCPELPFLPQLPTLGVSMIDELQGRTSPALGAFRAWAQRARPDAVKVQVVGPITLARVEEAALDVERILAQASALVQGLPGRPICALDEPMLGLGEPTRAEMDALLAALAGLQQRGIEGVLHCCSIPPWPHLQGIQTLSFDADQGLEAFAAQPWRPPHVWWGLIPTEGELPSVEELVERVRHSGLALDPRPVVTSSCGLAGLTIAQAERSLELAGAVARALALAR